MKRYESRDQIPTTPWWLSSGFTMALVPLLTGLYWLAVWAVSVGTGAEPFDAAALLELLKAVGAAGVGLAGALWRIRKGLSLSDASARITLGRPKAAKEEPCCVDGGPDSPA